MRDARLGISTAALHHNLRRVREAAPYSRVMAMVKADAYGHGARIVAETLASADGFGVAILEEALALRAAGIRQPITVLEGVFTPAEMFEAVRQNLTLVIHQEEQVALLEQCKLSGPVNVWLKLDTGMHRLGLAPETAVSAFRRIRSARITGELGLLTHFACADQLESPMTEKQLARFRAVQQVLTRNGELTLPESMANSAGILAWPATHGTWVRPGIMLYGSSPFPDQTAESLGLRPVMTLTSKLIAVRPLKKGEPVGYGASWVADRDTRIGVVGIGYGDGYPRHAPHGTPVLIEGRRVPLVGRVSMDMLTVDLGSVPAQVGDTCVLWGEGLPADEVATRAGTISYELFCKVTARVRREIW
ncbi:MAG: alanine racemase [Moraxellaceae bacterium]|jgi:alanine racemase|nr:alanine racemase [Moraxellaceae bacterium]